MCSLGEGYLPPIGNMARGGSRANLKGAVDNGGVFSSKEISKVSSSKGAQNLQKGAPDLFLGGANLGVNVNQITLPPVHDSFAI